MLDTSPVEPAVGGSRSVVDALRDDIKGGRYHPRERLVEADLAEDYGVKRSAVRAALIELTSEGLIERQPNRGARVRRVSIDEAIEFTEVRLSLQAMCAAKAAELGPADERGTLLDDIAILRGAVARNDQDSYIAANSRIFGRIREMAGHTTANRIIEQLLNRNIQQAFPYVLPERRMESLREFERIVDAVIAGDPDAAYEATVTHMDHVLAALRGIKNSGG